MAEPPSEAVARPVREAIPFVVITVVWTLIMLGLYGVFLVTKPSQIVYDPWVHVSVFAVPGIGFTGHVLREALHG